VNDFIATLDRMIHERRKMTSPLYQTIMSGNATGRLLQNFVVHRYPIKAFWTRNILGIASRVPDYALRVDLVENIYEEETGNLSHSKRHLQSFADFGYAVGATDELMQNGPLLPETKAVIDHNVEVCNGTVHFTAGVASVLLLMEGQPPITAGKASMLSVMRDTYGLPPEGVDFFVHHASSDAGASGVSELEDDHAATARELLKRYCDTPELQEQAVFYLGRALERRHAHFDAIHRFYDPAEGPFRYGAEPALAAR
jgi:pyrroloquinoline-quinone synthase